MSDLDRTLADVAAAVDEARLWRLHMEMAAFGATPRGGVCREALTPEDIEARVLMAEWGAALGCSLHMDELGSMFLRREGTDPDAPPVMTGSHLDSQPTGGRFDGAYGVLAGIEVLHALNAAGIRTRRPVEVANWTNEEGGRFTPGVMGSQVYVNPDELPRMLAVRDAAGVSIAEAMVAVRAALPGARPRALRTPVHAFVEGHIEQATLLEESGNQVGVVTGIQGTRKFRITVTGEDAHAGTTPRRRRRDALSAAVAMVSALERMAWDREDECRFTVGRFQAFPGAPSVVPGRVEFAIDLRHPDDAARRRIGDQIKPICEALAGACEVSVVEPQAADTVWFTGAVFESVRASAARLGIPHMELLSGAGHDARNMAAICPSGMVFVPCERGISHNEAENATPADLAAGTRVIAQVVTELACG